MYELLKFLRELLGVVSGALTAYILLRKAKELKTKRNGLPKGRS